MSDIKQQKVRVGDLVMPKVNTGSSYAMRDYLYIEKLPNVGRMELVMWKLSIGVVIKVDPPFERNKDSPTIWLTILLPTGEIGGCFDSEIYAV